MRLLEQTPLERNIVLFLYILAKMLFLSYILLLNFDMLCCLDHYSSVQKVVIVIFETSFVSAYLWEADEASLVAIVLFPSTLCFFSSLPMNYWKACCYWITALRIWEIFNLNRYLTMVGLDANFCSSLSFVHSTFALKLKRLGTKLFLVLWTCFFYQAVWVSFSFDNCLFS